MRDRETIGLAPLQNIDFENYLFHNPPLEITLRDIMHEIAEERANGKIKPFVEGEPIGRLPCR